MGRARIRERKERNSPHHQTCVYTYISSAHQCETRRYSLRRRFVLAAGVRLNGKKKNKKNICVYIYVFQVFIYIRFIRDFEKEMDVNVYMQV